MSTTDLYSSLLRPPVLHVLRAAGFTSARPAAVDTLVDLAARYLVLLARKTAQHAWQNHNSATPEVGDVRAALQDVGALWPELGDMEEQLLYDDDLRGLHRFLSWFNGDANREILRIGGLRPDRGEAPDAETGVEREDFLAGENSTIRRHESALIPTSYSVEEEAQQDRRRITVPGNCSWARR